ncbi:hypothetical protein AMIS_19910 [Actinoplanes missouriensis 431]|uniref:Uncharacterized protein n=1 Tax=Actinoplanes missouriensis (strain ATCC 14538 / DSM 43046 / CBS 188.64 / JCM 3121 / NBRC 102363 / NCIMB 12654 / NRRL B-3342 / UNCC 431) TaxID=512565 RepID=I0H2H4_ACTM4|nr:hypothetical protein [Actinoplanes missouriensis]BAL87211.1 hypothetical protein AMIS_19910 [Actinoplanes missouriensis 431]
MTREPLAALCARLYGTLTDEQPTMADDYTDLVLETVTDALYPHEVGAYPELLAAFVEAERIDLATVIAEYGPASSFRHVAWGDHPYQLVHSPAIVAVCERLSNVPMRFQALWDEQWESNAALEDLEGLWP